MSCSLVCEYTLSCYDNDENAVKFLNGMQRQKQKLFWIEQQLIFHPQHLFSVASILEELSQDSESGFFVEYRFQEIK